jgi:hypothetical protein
MESNNEHDALEQEIYDDFKPAEAAFVNNDLSKVLEKELSEIEAFKEDFDDQLMMNPHPQDELTSIAIAYIQGAGDVNQVNICNYHAKNGVALDAWGFNGDDDTTIVDLFLTMFVDPNEGDKLNATSLERHFNWLQRFYDQSISGSIFSKIEDNKSDLYQVAKLINATKDINRIRFFILTNAITPLDYEKETTELNESTTCEYYIWDARRIMQQDNIISGRSPIIVDFEGDYNCTLPCVKMPDVSPNVMCYLCIIPGIVLSQVYNKYHQQILEMNVRTFLQFKGTSNKGIRDTLIGHKATPQEVRKGLTDVEAEPDMFFSYNNGISATASEVSLNEDGTAIRKIKSWQIVNGGQTTAAISAVTKMKDVDISKLASVYVAMKISVIKDADNLETIVPKISRFANTQSAIKKSDYNINEKFLIELEQRSREEWVMTPNNKPVSKWFFERTRGQYLDKAKHMPSASAEKEFYAEYPKEQMFDKTFLSKFMMAWEQNPSMVCKGGENNYGAFFERMLRSKATFDSTKFHRAIAKAILFKAIDAYYGKDGIALVGYKSNMVAYTMAALSYISSKSIDLDAIWNEQCVISPSLNNELTISIYNVYAKLVTGNEHVAYKVKESYTDGNGRKRNRYTTKEIPSEELEKLRNTKLYKILMYVKSIHSLIYTHITKISEGENINEWTKKSICWDALKTKMPLTEAGYKIPSELCSLNGDLDNEVTEGQQKVIDSLSETDAKIWKNLSLWSKESFKLTPKEQAFIGNMAYRIERNLSISYKQAKWALSIKDKAEELGWKAE